MSNLLNPDAIFSNNEMSLSDIEIYGFDYDYTLVFYSKHLHTLIFNAARDLLINEHRVRPFVLHEQETFKILKNTFLNIHRGKICGKVMSGSSTRVFL